MASSPELVQYIADQLSPCGTITFGENVCANTVWTISKSCENAGFRLRRHALCKTRRKPGARSLRICLAGPALSRRKRLPAHAKTWITATCLGALGRSNLLMNCPRPKAEEKGPFKMTEPFLFADRLS